MKLFCVSTKLSEEQSQRIWSQRSQFSEIKDFGLIVGQDYWVYGLAVVSGEPWVYVLSPSKYLRPVPLCLFKITDRRISKYWVVKLDSAGNINISYPTIVDNPYYLDDLSEYDTETVRDFQRIQELLYTEFDDAESSSH